MRSCLRTLPWSCQGDSARRGARAQAIGNKTASRGPEEWGTNKCIARGGIFV